MMAALAAVGAPPAGFNGITSSFGAMVGRRRGRFLEGVDRREDISEPMIVM
jgi:hypothetical protein